MIFQLRVTLQGIKGFFRVYHVDGATSLYTLHRQMRSDMEFAQDQLIMFKALDVLGDVVGRYGLFDLGAGTVDRISLGQVIREGATDFEYFYDVNNRKSVHIIVEGEVEGARLPEGKVLLAESKGPNPVEFENGYVAYEDLPDAKRHLPGEAPAGGADLDDEDFDDEDAEDEAEDDEDGKEIYDENE